MRTKETKHQAATFRGKVHVAIYFSSQSLHAQLTDNGAAAESTKGQGAAELSEGESPSLRVMADGQELAARTVAIGEVFSSRRGPDELAVAEILMFNPAQMTEMAEILANDGLGAEAVKRCLGNPELVTALVEPAEAIKGRALSGLAKQRRRSRCHHRRLRRPQPRKSRRSTRARAART